MAQSIWYDDDPDAEVKFPLYGETIQQLSAVLNLAVLKGITGPELAAALGTLHAKAIARLNPTQQQLDRALLAFAEVVLANQADLHGKEMEDGWSPDRRYSHRSG